MKPHTYYSAAASGLAGWALAQPEFGSLVNPITTRIMPTTLLLAHPDLKSQRHLWVWKHSVSGSHISLSQYPFRDYGLDHILFRNKMFLNFQDRKLKVSVSIRKKILWNLTKFQLFQLIQKIFIFIFSISCLIELKFCEVSQRKSSNRCLKNKKVLYLKKSRSL